MLRKWAEELVHLVDAPAADTLRVSDAALAHDSGPALLAQVPGDVRSRRRVVLLARHRHQFTRTRKRVCGGGLATPAEGELLFVHVICLRLVIPSRRCPGSHIPSSGSA